MAIKTWYDGLQDSAALKNDCMASNPDIYISEVLYEGDAVYTTATTLFTVAGATYTIDELISTGALNFTVLDNNAVAASGKITTNAATTVTVPTMTLESDETTSPTLTDGASYKIRILTPSTNLYGQFFGYVEGQELNIEDEYMTFQYGIPKKTKFKDLMERKASLSGGTVNIANSDILSTIFGAELYGLNDATQEAQGIGSVPDENKTYRVVFDGEDRQQKRLAIICSTVEFSSSGNILGGSEAGYKMINFSGDILSDAYYPEGVDLIRIKRTL